MSDMAKMSVRYLTRRGDCYYFRRGIPELLRNAIGLREFKVSFGACSLAEAKRRTAKNTVATDTALLDAARSILPNAALLSLDELADFEIEKMIADWSVNRLQSRMGQRIPFGGSSKKLKIDELVLSLQTDIADLSDRESDNYLPFLQEQGSKLLIEKGYRANVAHPNYWRLMNSLRRKELEVTRCQLAYYEDTPDLEGRERKLLWPVKSTAGRSSSPHQMRSGKSLQDIIDEMMSHPDACKLSNASIRSKSESFKLITEYFGSTMDVAELDREGCKAFREMLLRLPKNFKNRFPNCAISDAGELDVGNAQIVSRKTVSKHLGRLHELCKFACDEGYINKNPALGLSIRITKEDKNERKPFTIQELNALFSSPNFSGPRKAINKDRDVARYWMPLIALYSGMRLNECCQLDIADIYEDDGVWMIRVTDEGTEPKRLKNDNASRKIPIHPKLIELGLLSHVNAMRKRGEDRLWPGITPDRNGTYTNKFQKWFSRYLTGTGIKTASNSFHSFRHNFRTEMANQDARETFTRKIGGWSVSDGIDANYFHELSPAKMYDEIAKIKYEGLDLTHLI